MPNPTNRPPHQLSRGINLILLAAVSNALLILLVKFSAASLPISLIVFVRFVITLFILLPICLIKYRGKMLKQLKTDRLKFHIFRDSVGFFGIFTFFYAAKHISLANTSLLFNTSPLFVPIIAFFWQKLKIFHRLWWGLGIGFLGVVFILHPGKDMFQWAAILGLLSGFIAALVLITNRLLAYTEPPLRTLFYYFFIGSILGFFVWLPEAKESLQQLNWHNALLLLGVGISGYLYQFFVTTSTRYAPVRLTSSFLYVSVIISLFFDWYFLGRVGDFYDLLGIVLVIVGGVLIVLMYPKDDYQKR